MGGSVTAVIVSVSPASTPSLSLANTSIGLAPRPRSTVAVSSLATGSSFTFVTVIETVAVSVPPLPSEIE